MEEIGYVKKIIGNYAEVIFTRKSACGGNCGSCKGDCSANLVSVDIENKLNALQGNRVKVMMKSKSFHKSIFWVYIFPSIMFLLGLFIGIDFFQKAGYKNYELIGGLVGFSFVGISYTISNKIDKKVRQDDEYNLEMVKIID